MKLGKPIALGRTAEIYDWEEGQVLKLFRDWVSSGSVAYEARLARAVHAAGLPVPAVGEIVEVDGRHGLVYERVEGVSMLEALQSQPWLLSRYVRSLAELHVEMHDQPVPELPSQRERLERKIQAAKPLPSDLKEAALNALQALPEGERLCHGDFHPDNILLTAQGPVIIDWIDATSGHPLADVARTTVLMTTGGLPAKPLSRVTTQMIRGLFLRIYLRRYFQLRPEGREELAAWLPIIAAARLDEGIDEEEAALLKIARRGLL